jgi:hypothetical protein
VQYSIYLPYRRTSPVHIPRSDLVLSAADSLLLTVVVVESDHPSAQTIVLSGDADGPAMQLVLWDDSNHCYGWGSANGYGYGADYGWGYPFGLPPRILLTVQGEPGSVGGSWEFYVPTGTFSIFPVRCGWAILLLWNQGAKSSLLGQGTANFTLPFFPVPTTLYPPYDLTTDALQPILTSDTTLLLETS